MQEEENNLIHEEPLIKEPHSNAINFEYPDSEQSEEEKELSDNHTSILELPPVEPYEYNPYTKATSVMNPNSGPYTRPIVEIRIRDPVYCQCQNCGNVGMSEVRFKRGKASVISTSLTCCIGAVIFLPCACLGLAPWFTDKTKDVEHFCSSCGQKFATVSRLNKI